MLVAGCVGSLSLEHLRRPAVNLPSTQPGFLIPKREDNSTWADGYGPAAKVDALTLGVGDTGVTHL